MATVSRICLARKRLRVNETDVLLIDEKSPATSITSDLRAESSRSFLISMSRSSQMNCVCFSFASGSVTSIPLRMSGMDEIEAAMSLLRNDE